MEEKAEQIAEILRALHIPYDDISAKKKAEVGHVDKTDIENKHIKLSIISICICIGMNL